MEAVLQQQQLLQQMAALQQRQQAPNPDPVQASLDRASYQLLLNQVQGQQPPAPQPMEQASSFFSFSSPSFGAPAAPAPPAPAAPRFNLTAAVAAAAQAEQAAGASFFSFDTFDAPKEASANGQGAQPPTVSEIEAKLRAKGSKEKKKKADRSPSAKTERSAASPVPRQQLAARSKSRSRSRQKKKAKKDKAKDKEKEKARDPSLSPLVRKRAQHKSPSPKKKESKEKKTKDSKEKKSKDNKHRSPSPKDRKGRSASPKDRKSGKNSKASKEESRKEPQKPSADAHPPPPDQSPPPTPRGQTPAQAPPPDSSKLHRAQARARDAMWQQSAPPKIPEKPALAMNPVLAAFMQQQQAAQAHADKKAEKENAHIARQEAEERARQEAERAAEEAERARLEAIRQREEEERRAIEEALLAREREEREKAHEQIRKQLQLEQERHAAEEARKEEEMRETVRRMREAKKRAKEARTAAGFANSEDEADVQLEQEKKSKLANEIDGVQSKFAAILAEREREAARPTEPASDKKEKRRRSRSKSRSKRRRRSRSKSRSRRKRSHSKDRRDRGRRSRGRRSRSQEKRRSRKRSRSRRKRSRSRSGRSRDKRRSPSRPGFNGWAAGSKEDDRPQQPGGEGDKGQAELERTLSRSLAAADAEAPQSREQMIRQQQVQLQLMGQVRHMRMQLQQIQQVQILHPQQSAMLHQLKMLEQLGHVQPEQQAVLGKWQQFLTQSTANQQQQQQQQLEKQKQEHAEQQKHYLQEQQNMMQQRQHHTMGAAMAKSSGGMPEFPPPPPHGMNEALMAFKSAGKGKGKVFGKDQAFPPVPPAATSYDSGGDSWDNWNDDQSSQYFTPKANAGGGPIKIVPDSSRLGAQPKGAMPKPSPMQTANANGGWGSDWAGSPGKPQAPWGKDWNDWGEQPDDWFSMPGMAAAPRMSPPPSHDGGPRPPSGPPPSGQDWQQEEEMGEADWNHEIQNSWGRDYDMDEEDDDDDDWQEDWQDDWQDWNQDSQQNGDQANQDWQTDDGAWQDNQSWWKDDQSWGKQEDDQEELGRKWKEEQDEATRKWEEQHKQKEIPKVAASWSSKGSWGKDEQAANSSKGKAKGAGTNEESAGSSKGKAKGAGKAETIKPVADTKKEKNFFVKTKNYSGTFSHPSLGKSSIVIKLTLATATSGHWVAAGQKEKITVAMDKDGETIRMSDSTTKLEGKEGANGVLSGVVIQEGKRGGRFNLAPKEPGSKDEEDDEWGSGKGRGKKGKGKGKKGKEEKEGKGKGKKDKKKKKDDNPSNKRRAGDAPPDKFDADHWEEPKESSGLKLITDLAPKGTKWKDILSDPGRRSFCAYLPKAFTTPQCSDYFERIKHGTNWLQPNGAFGKVPRKTAWMVKKGCNCTYRYGGSEVKAQEFPPWMLEVLKHVMPLCGMPDPKDWPDSCNMNTYEDGNMSVGWHADDEQLFQGKFRDIAIISLSFGQRRKFDLRLNHPEGDEQSKAGTVGLGNGDLCTMEGMFQKHYQHRVPKEAGIKNSPRINLTWRWIVKHEPKCPAGRQHNKR